MTAPAPCLRTAQHRRLGEVVVVDGVPNVSVSEVGRRTRGCYATRSGRKADGGPGCKVAGFWCWPRRRYDRDALLRAELEALVASNGRDFERNARAQAVLREIRKSSKQPERRN